MLAIYRLLAFLLDLGLADPPNWPHPVKFYGRFIRGFERLSQFDKKKPMTQTFLGGVLVFLLLIIILLISSLLLYGAKRLSPILYALVWIYLTYTCFAVKGLADEANGVLEAMKEGGLQAGRRQLSRIVGRETSQLSEEEVYQAVIETVAENLSDGFVAPLFYVILFGPVGGLLYKGINTLDSMIAYLDDRYQYFGYFAAKLDDLANYIPARLSCLLIVLASGLLGLDMASAWKISFRDGRAHRSPNAGYPEAAAAGALGVQLGGTHVYHGQPIEKPTIGDPQRLIGPQQVKASIALLYTSASLAMALSMLMMLISSW